MEVRKRDQKEHAKETPEADKPSTTSSGERVRESDKPKAAKKEAAPEEKPKDGSDTHLDAESGERAKKMEDRFAWARKDQEQEDDRVPAAKSASGGGEDAASSELGTGQDRSAEETAALIEENPEALVHFEAELAELDEEDAQHAIRDLAEASKENREVRDQVVDWIAGNEEVRDNEVVLDSLTRAALEGNPELLEATEQEIRLRDQDAAKDRYANAVRASELYDEIRTVNPGDPRADVENTLKELGELPPETLRTVLGDGRAEALAANALFSFEQGSGEGEVLRELSRLTGKVGDEELVTDLALSVSNYLENSPDTAGGAALELRDYVAGGGDATLAATVARVGGQQLESFRAEVIEGINEFSAHAEDVGRRVQELTGDLEYLTLNYGSTLEPEELEAAVQEFKDGHPEFAELEAIGDSAVRNLQLVQGLGGETEPDTAQAARAASLALSSASGQREFGELLAREGRGEETVLSDLDALPGDSDEDRQAIETLKNARFQVGISEAARLSGENGQAAAQEVLEGVQNTGGLDELAPSQSRAVTDALKGLVDARGESAILAARDELESVLDDAELPESSRLRLNAAGTALGLAGVALEASDLADGDATARDWAEFLAAGTEFGADHFSGTLSRFLSKGGATAVSGAAAGVGVLFSTLDAVAAFSEGDVTQGALSTTGALGSALAAAGAFGAGTAFTGVGLVLGLGAAVGSVAVGQYRRVEASNHFESGDTDIFLNRALSDAGLSEEQQSAAVDELRNADSEGRLTGVLIQAAAEELDIEANDLLNELAQLDSGTIKRIIEAGHGVDPTDDTDFESLREEDVREWIDVLYENHVAGLPER